MLINTKVYALWRTRLPTRGIPSKELSAKKLNHVQKSRDRVWRVREKRVLSQEAQKGTTDRTIINSKKAPYKETQNTHQPPC